MTKAAQVIENVQIKKKKIRIRRNTKKSWRKNIDLVDIETHLDIQRDDERLGVLGEETSNLLFLDTGDKADDTEIEAPATDAAVPLKYTIDTGTGLKLTGRPKIEKLLYAHRLLAGNPGVKPVKKRCHFRVEHTHEHKIAKKLHSLANPRNAAKLQFKEERAKHSLKLAKKQKLTVQKLSFDNDLWSKPEVTLQDGFTAVGIDHANRVMCKKLVLNRVSAAKPNKIPVLPLPHAGLSYNPSLESHQRLLLTAVSREQDRVISKLKSKDSKQKNFPLGALRVNSAELVEDMNPQCCTATMVMNPSDAPEPPPNAVITKGRTTHQQRLKTMRYKRQLKEDGAKKLLKKRENEVHRIGEFNKEMDGVDAELKDRATKRYKMAANKKFKSSRFYHEQDVEVALGDQLHSSLRQVEPTSNPVKESIQNIYRRGLMYSTPRDRNYQRDHIRGCKHKRKRAAALGGFTEKDVFEKELEDEDLV